MSLQSWLKGKKPLVTTNVQSEVRTTIRPDQGDVDRAVIAQLRTAGLDLSAPFPIRYVFSAPSRENARQLAQALEARGFHPELSEEGGRWKIAAPEEVVLTEDGVAARRSEFTSLAQNFGAQYHGWEMKAKQTKTVTLS